MLCEVIFLLTLRISDLLDAGDETRGSSRRVLAGVEVFGSFRLVLEGVGVRGKFRLVFGVFLSLLSGLSLAMRAGTQVQRIGVWKVL